MPSNERMIILEARRLQRLATRKARLTRVYRKAMKDIAAEMRLVRKNLRGLARPSKAEPDDPLPPLREFGETGGVK